MKIDWCGFLAAETQWDSILPKQGVALLGSKAIKTLELAGREPHAIVAYAAWMTSPDAEDRPGLGAIAFLVQPDGTRVQLGGGASGGWGTGMSSAAVQALAFPVAGRYAVEIRPASTRETDRGLLTLDPVGERVLGSASLDVRR